LPIVFLIRVAPGLEFDNNNAKQLYAIPVLFDDYVDSNGRLINIGKCWVILIQ